METFRLPFRPVPDPKNNLVSFRVKEIRPAPENEKIYRPVSPDDPDIIALAESIKRDGVLEPLVITRDRYILSGHRRHMACKLAGVENVLCRVEGINHDNPCFLPLLREYNRSRVKTFDEVVREQVVSAAVDPEAAYQSLLDHRKKVSTVTGRFIPLTGSKTRARISPAKRPMLEVAIRIINEQREYWPLSDRSIHYDMLNDPPLRHASKPDSRYINDKHSYKDLTNLLTRGRLTGEIPFEAIADPTRTVVIWPVDPNVGNYLSGQLKDFLTKYWRDLQQSQPNHIEIVGEKNTIESSISPIALNYCIPYTLGRGYCSLDPRYKMAERFRKSGRENLIILVLSDFDPEGEDIPHSFARSMRDDFAIANVCAKKVCLTYNQVIERNLPQTFDLKKKKDGARYKPYVAKYGDRAHELEALPNAERSALLDAAINEVLDIDAFNRETDAEREDAARLERCRKAIAPALAKVFEQE